MHVLYVVAQVLYSAIQSFVCFGPLRCPVGTYGVPDKGSLMMYLEAVLPDTQKPCTVTQSVAAHVISSFTSEMDSFGTEIRRGVFLVQPLSLGRR